LNFARSGADDAPRPWIGTVSDGLWRCAGGRAEKLGAPELAALHGIDTLVEDADGALILYAQAGFWRWADGVLEAVRFPADADPAALRAPVLAPDHDGAAMIATDDGLFRLRGRDATRAFPASRAKTASFHRVERDAQGRQWRA